MSAPLDTFRARCEAQALLVRQGKRDFLDAVDAAQNAAVAFELVDETGQDEVQHIIAIAFQEARP